MDWWRESANLQSCSFAHTCNVKLLLQMMELLISVENDEIPVDQHFMYLTKMFENIPEQVWSDKACWRFEGILPRCSENTICRSIGNILTQLCFLNGKCLHSKLLSSSQNVPYEWFGNLWEYFQQVVVVQLCCWIVCSSLAKSVLVYFCSQLVSQLVSKHHVVVAEDDGVLRVVAVYI